ncbi:MAG: penicillin-binding protein 2 [Candidatus Aminicenantes bacterium]|nr:penicillin-binding protein 2 [Candidatus Aminicenantes bacterium]
MTNSIYEDLSLILRRSRKIFILVGIAFVLIILILWKIQIIDHKKYWELSEANRLREISIPAQRGIITDRKGVILAKNNASFKVSIIRENCADLEKSCVKIAKLLNLEPAVLSQRIEKFKTLPDFHPIVIKDNLTPEEVAMFESRKLELPELLLQSEPKRNYPLAACASHIIGYVQELSLSEINFEKYKDKKLGDLVGKTGIEKRYDAQLSGKDGLLIEIVDSLGQTKERIQDRPPISGRKIELTLDFDIQQRCEELLEGKEGAIVVLDPKNGEVLAMASYPDYDPNKFINRFTPEEWLELVNSTEYPLENRATRGLYSPGSTFKPAMLLAALDSKTITDRTTFYCSGLLKLYGNDFFCWNRGGHGSVDIYESIQNSCNVYFYNLGKMMHIETIADYAWSFGFGQKTGIDLPDEKTGIVPDPEWKMSTTNTPWYPGETISVSIGQGPFLVTPLQIAVYTSLIANRGKNKPQPHLVREHSDPMPNSLDISEEIFEKVIEGMWRAVNKEGTARAAHVDGLEICGKTGSTQVISRETAKRLAEKNIVVKTHSWFAGFAPRKDPEIIVTVLVEFGGMGGSTAAPLAKEVFKLWEQIQW